MKIKYAIRQLASLLMAVAAVLGSPLYGAEAKPVLKLEDAISSAFVYSTQMSINSKENNTLKEQMKFGSEATYYQYQTIYLTKAKNEQQKTMLQDKIARDVTYKYYDMLILQKEIEVLNRNIDISTKELRQSAIKNQKGQVNPITYQTQEIELMTLKTSKTSKEEELKNAQLYFKVVTGKDLMKYVLDENMAYEPFRIIGSVEGFINSKISIYLQYDKELAKLHEENIITEGAQPVLYTSYIKSKNDAETVSLQLEDQQKTLKQNLINAYSSLLSLEEQIEALNLKIEIADKNLKTAKLRHQGGLISDLEYNKQLVNKEKIQLDILKLIHQYNHTKENIEKPWTA